MSKTAKQLLTISNTNDSNQILVACLFALRSVATIDGFIDHNEKNILIQRFSSIGSFDQDGSIILENFLNESSNASYSSQSDFDQAIELISDFNESIYILFYCLACEMALIDGVVVPSERKLLDRYRSSLGISTNKSTIIEEIFLNQKNASKIDPVEYDDILKAIDINKITQYNQSITQLITHIYKIILEFKNIKENRPKTKVLTAINHIPSHDGSPQRKNTNTIQSLQDTIENASIRRDLENELQKIDRLPSSIFSETHRLAIKKIRESSQSNQFRISVIGSFSSGKSTFLNALVRHTNMSIFPSSPIPCTSTINILRYGAKINFLKLLKTGQETPISQQEYESIIELPDDINQAGTLKNDEITALIVEAPIQLCQKGVELIDSPGLYEQQSRTEITENFIKKSDAVIFLFRADHLLTEKERESISKLSQNIKLNNVFFVINFFDTIDPQQRIKVETRARSYIEKIYTDNKINPKDKIHFISSLLVSSNPNQSNEWQASFEILEKSIGNYIVNTSGAIRWRHMANDVINILANVYDNLSFIRPNNQSESIDQKIRQYKLASTDISKGIEEIKKKKEKVKITIKISEEELLNEIIKEFKNLLNTMPEELKQKSELWKSDASPIWNKSKLIEDYQNQLQSDVKNIIDNWSNKKLSNTINVKFKQLIQQLDHHFIEINKQFNALEHILDPNYEMPDIERDSPFITFMKGAGGFLSGGPIGAVVGASMSTEDIAINAAATFATGFALAALGVGGPITLAIGAAFIGALQLLLGQDGMRNKARENILRSGIEAIPNIIESLSKTLTTQINNQFNLLQNDVQNALTSQIELLKTRSEEYAQFLEKLKTDKNAAELELDRRKKELESVFKIGKNLEKIGTINFEENLKIHGHDMDNGKTQIVKKTLTPYKNLNTPKYKSDKTIITKINEKSLENYILLLFLTIAILLFTIVFIIYRKH